MKKILVVIGTRPEAIKLAPVILRLKSEPSIHLRICLTGQHRDLIAPIFTFFGISSDDDLAVMTHNQNLGDVTAIILTKLNPILTEYQPDLVIVQGDTSTAFSAALAAFYQKIPVAHVEAGLRSSDPYSPFPEEMNRRLISKLSHLHFCPTPLAAKNLISEGISKDTIFVTGNTAIDALLMAKKQLTRSNQFSFLPHDCKMILITVHRRESFGEGILQICSAISTLASQYPDLHFVFPLHPNPNVEQVVHQNLDGIANVHIIPPQDYISFIELMDRSYLIMTDSGGIQEEAPSLNKPVLVLREITERPEVIECGVARLIGLQSNAIIEAVGLLLSDSDLYQSMASAPNPYGGGQASDQIIKQLQ